MQTNITHKTVRTGVIRRQVRLRLPRFDPPDEDDDAWEATDPDPQGDDFWDPPDCDDDEEAEPEPGDFWLDPDDFED